MKQHIHTEERKLSISMVGIFLAAILTTIILSLTMAVYVNQAVKAAFSGIIGTVVQHYPEAETLVVQELRSPEDDSVHLGDEVLEKYGLSNWSARETGIATRMLVRLLPAGLALVGLVCIGFGFLLFRYQRAISDQAKGLSMYLRRIDSGDYSLDVRDNGEGSFSLLKNDLYKVTIRLREQAELLQKEKTALSNLIADISHQIKTPLTSLGVLADLLAEDPPETNRRMFIKRLRAQLGCIQWLVTTLLKLARLDSGTAAFKSETVNVHHLIERALEPLLIPLEIKKQQLVIQGSQEASFIGDLNWSSEALTNVIKNCIEHTFENGRIEINYSTNALYTEIIISDNGEGIARRDLPNIFNRFHRGENASENSVGIGLALAKAIFTTQGGDISVRSKPDIGTVFDIRIFHMAV